MNDFSIKPDVISIAKSKKRFLYIGIGILIFNFYCVIGYIQLALNGELVGYYLFIFALVNLPLFIVSVILLFVPRLHRRYYERLEYQFDDQELSIGNSRMSISDIQGLEIVEFYLGFYKVYVFSKDDKVTELCGISLENLDQIKRWAHVHHLNIR